MGLATFLGIDVGSVTTKLAVLDEKGKYVDSYMLRTAGQPVKAVQEGMRVILKQAKQIEQMPSTSLQVVRESMFLRC